MTTMNPFKPIAIVAIVCLFFCLDPVNALPQYSVEFKQSCNLCHHNPNGGGMRNLYGAQFFSYMKLADKNVEDFEKLERIQPQISNNLSIGADFRSFFLYADNPDESTFLTMQGDMYFAYALSDKALLYAEKGIASGYEFYAQLQGLGNHGFVKFGRFIPAYGWRFVDHNTYTRVKLGYSTFAPNRIIEDNGVEGGIHKERWEFSTALTNGSTAPIDGDKGKAITMRGAIRLTDEPLKLTLGGSYRYGEVGRQENLMRYYGVFSGFNVNNLTYLVESNIINRGGSNALVTSNVLYYRLRRGFELNAGYDFYDRNLDESSGIDTRLKLGLDWYVTGYFSFEPAITFNDESGRKFKQAIMMVHFWL